MKMYVLKTNIIKITTSLIVFLTIIISWLKAGLAYTELLTTLSFILIVGFFLLIKKEISNKIYFISFLPLILICSQFFLSCINPMYRVLSEEEFVRLDIEKILAEETDIEKVYFTSESFKNIFYLSNIDPELSIAVFFDFKNLYFDKFPKSSSKTANLIYKYEKLITNKIYSFLPSLPIFHSQTISNFINKLSQFSIGLILFFLINKRRYILIILKIIAINTGSLAVVGIWQKLNYIPTANQLEIFGLWDAPEPRYFFSSFTYKNHWSAFALLGLSICIALLNHGFRRQGELFFKKKINFILFLSAIANMISIPLSGSRSGIVILIILLIVLLILLVYNFKIRFINKFIIFSSALFIILFLLFFVGKIDNNNRKEIENITKIQFEGLKKGNKPFRLLLWDDLINQILLKPFYGYGFNSYRALNPIFQSKEVRTERRRGIEAAHKKYIPLTGYGHNDWLEKISEFGFLGFILFLPYFIYFFYHFCKSISTLSKILFFGVFSYFIFSFVDFPSQTPACLLLVSATIGLSLKYSFLTKSS